MISTVSSMNENTSIITFILDLELNLDLRPLFTRKFYSMHKSGDRITISTLARKDLFKVSSEKISGRSKDVQTPWSNTYRTR